MLNERKLGDPTRLIRRGRFILSIQKLVWMLGAILFITACPSPKNGSSSSSVIQLGAIHALSGSAAPYGKWAKNGVDLAVSEINEKGGINGKKVEIVEQDTGSDAKAAVGALNLLADQHIPVVFGPTATSEVMACAPIADQRRIVILTSTAGGPQIATAGDFVFRNRDSGEAQIGKLAEYSFGQAGLRKAAVLHASAANGVGYKDTFVEDWEKLGGKILTVESFDEGQTDFRGALTRVKATHPDAIFLAGDAREIGPVLKQIKELQVPGKILASVGAETPETIRIAGSAAEGMLIGSSYFLPNSAEPDTARFVKAYRTKYGDEPSIFAVDSYDAAMLVASIVGRTGSDSEKVKQALYGTRDFRGANGSFGFDANGEVNRRPVVKTVRDGNFVLAEMSGAPQ